MKTYKTQSTCSRAINYEVKDGIVTACEIVGIAAEKMRSVLEGRVLCARG